MGKLLKDGGRRVRIHDVQFQSPRRLKIEDKASIAVNADPWSFSILRPLLSKHRFNPKSGSSALAAPHSGLGYNQFQLLRSSPYG
jgi:hypothetical protein